MPEFEKRWDRFSRPVGCSWRVDETYISVKGQWWIPKSAWYDEQGRLQLEPKKDINAKLGERRSTDALDSIALTVALEFPMLVDDGAPERMRENDYNPIFGVVR